MSTQLPNSRQVPRFAGLTTFCRFPRIQDVDRKNQPVDWALYGVPYDGGVTYRPGARFGPRAIREASQYMKPVNIELGVDVAEALSLADAGDAPIRPFSPQETAEAVVAHAMSIGDPSHTKLFAVGGDHSVAYANIRATWERRGKPKGGLGLLHFDAHLDTVDTVWDEKWSHASPFIRAIEDGLIDPKRMLSIGIRGPLNSEDDLDFAREHGVAIVTSEMFRSAEGIVKIDDFLHTLGADEVYLTFDIDCVDPAFAPGTGTPVCGGLSSSEALSLLRRCVGANIVGADVVEVLPDRDVAGITSLLAAHVIMEVLAVSVSSE
jgi:agmatinase